MEGQPDSTNTHIKRNKERRTKERDRTNNAITTLFGNSEIITLRIHVYKILIGWRQTV